MKRIKRAIYKVVFDDATKNGKGIGTLVFLNREKNLFWRAMYKLFWFCCNY